MSNTRRMKNTLFILVIFTLFSCKKSAEVEIFTEKTTDIMAVLSPATEIIPIEEEIREEEPKDFQILLKII